MCLSTEWDLGDKYTYILKFEEKRIAGWVEGINFIHSFMHLNFQLLQGILGYQRWKNNPGKNWKLNVERIF